MTWMDEFREVVEDPAAYAKKWKEEGGRRIVGYFCSYTPEEIIHAARAHPLRLFGTGETVHLADAHLQAYCCSLVRGALEGALAGHLAFLDGAVFPHTCDSIQRLSDVWRMNVKGPFHLDIILPVKLDSESAKEYMAEVLKKFRRDLEDRLSVKIGEDALRESIARFNRIRGFLGRLYEMKRERPEIISGSDLYTIVKASMIMDRDRLLDLLPRTIADLEKKETAAEAGARRLVLAGGVCNHPDIYRIIEETGGTIVWDDLCTGSRYFEGQTEEGKDPITALAERYLARPPCPAKHAGLFSRAEHLVRIVKEKGAEGVVFFFLKFCDPHAFDYPYMKEALDREGIPSIMVEAEDPLPSEAQLRTRFETFIQMI
jgi:bzd-type benzoyl-CoA reductase N subunit